MQFIKNVHIVRKFNLMELIKYVAKKQDILFLSSDDKLTFSVEDDNREVTIDGDLNIRTNGPIFDDDFFWVDIKVSEVTIDEKFETLIQVRETITRQFDTRIHHNASIRDVAFVKDEDDWEDTSHSEKIYAVIDGEIHHLGIVIS